MSLTERLREGLDESFGSEPAQRSVEQRIADGRRALRRRRLAGAAVACGAVVVLGTTYALGGSGPSRDSGRVVASDPPGTTSPSPSAVWEDDTPVRYVDGELQVRPGVVVHQHIENPYDYRPPKQSDALDLTYDDQRMWVLAEMGDGGYGYDSTVPSDHWASFRAWVEDRVGGGRTEHDWPMTMQQTPDGRILPAQGARLYQRTDHPDLGDGFAPPGATTGAAIVRPYGSSWSYFVVWRVIDGQLNVITTPPRDSVGATFDELLRAARTRYATGEALR